MPIPDEATHDPSTVAYDHQLVPWLFEHWAEPFIDLAAPPPSAHLLDLACGSGLITRHLLARLGHDGRIDAVDIDPAMVAYASSTVDDERVRWHVADAASVPVDDAGVDGVYCHQGLQFLPDPLGVLHEIARTLRPGGRLTVAAWGRLGDNPWPAALAAATRTVLGDDATTGMTTVCSLGDPTRLATLLRHAGFEDAMVETRAHTAVHPDVHAAIAGQLQALPSGSITDHLDDEQRARLAAEMGTLLAPHTDTDGTLSVPSTSVLASAVIT